MSDQWYAINEIDAIDSPSLVVYRDRVKENIRQLVTRVGEVNRLRPHVKTNKMAEVCGLMLASGITRFKCATIAEAEMLGLLQAPEVLLAHQPVGPKKERLLSLVKQFPTTHFTCIADNRETLKQFSDLCMSAGQRLQFYIDLNTGMNRSGIIPEKAFELFTYSQTLPAIRIIGLHAYDGHIRDTDPMDRNRKADSAFEKVASLAEQINQISSRKMTIVIAGSPSFPSHLKREDVELSPGTFVFWDWGYKHLLPEEPYDYAALVITRIISILDENTFCTDLGHKSVAAENPLPRVHFLNAPEAVPVSQSEEHLVAKVPDSSLYKVGDVLYGVPVHICPTIALYDSATIIENNKAIDHWKVVARSRKITI